MSQASSGAPPRQPRPAARRVAARAEKRPERIISDNIALDSNTALSQTELLQLQEQHQQLQDEEEKEEAISRQQMLSPSLGNRRRAPVEHRRKNQESRSAVNATSHFTSEELMELQAHLRKGTFILGVLFVQIFEFLFACVCYCSCFGFLLPWYSLGFSYVFFSNCFSRF
jgi:hypothetical protein